ncbi:hypothetical protein [Pseudomonas palleroniana]|uniref:hypothetical protein n=1 Tax=Pseudomonas palleroniana TaxID=191390 RepID=UPI0018E6ACE5|nr:hypothetical protein [Pseudomonas palleroniana]MBI6907140.1 hypothetical protein [Pseudomonas palleroniana]
MLRLIILIAAFIGSVLTHCLPLLSRGYGNQPVWIWLFCVNVAARAVNFGGSSRRDYLALLEHAARAGKKSREIPASLQDSILLQDDPAVIARQARL